MQNEYTNTVETQGQLQTKQYGGSVEAKYLQMPENILWHLLDKSLTNLNTPLEWEQKFRF